MTPYPQLDTIQRTGKTSKRPFFVRTARFVRSELRHLISRILSREQQNRRLNIWLGSSKLSMTSNSLLRQCYRTQPRHGPILSRERQDGQASRPHRRRPKCSNFYARGQKTPTTEWGCSCSSRVSSQRYVAS